MESVTPEPIMRVALGYMAAKHLFVANEIGLFEKLAGKTATLDELAQTASIPRRTVRIVADAMASLGLLENAARDFTGTEKARLNLTFNATLDELTGLGKAELFDPQGALMRSLDFTIRGGRIKVESP
jgi:hypothetical protein